MSKLKDWHKADIVAALHKAGTSCRKLSKEHGYSPHAIHCALHKPWPRGELLIADRLGLLPQKIWPSRYDASGKPNRPKTGRPKLITHELNNSTSAVNSMKMRSAA